MGHNSIDRLETAEGGMAGLRSIDNYQKQNVKGLLLKNIDVCKTLMPPFPNIYRIGLTFDPDL